MRICGDDEAILAEAYTDRSRSAAMAPQAGRTR